MNIVLNNLIFDKGVFCIKLDVLYLGDIIDILDNKVEDNSVDLIFLDPPYNIGKKFGNWVESWGSEEEYLEWCYSWLDICIRKLKPTGSLYFMSATQYMPYFDLYLRKKLHILSRIVWTYDSSGVQAKKYFGSLYEPILHCVKNKNHYTFNYNDILIEAKTGSKRKLIDYRGKEPKEYSSLKVPGNVWDFVRVRFKMSEYIDHPSQKPESLLERIIKVSSNVGDVVLDPFSGTFTTCAVAKRLGRHYIGIEKDNGYYNSGLKRLSKGDD